jgi:hypothetical protein
MNTDGKKPPLQGLPHQQGNGQLQQAPSERVSVSEVEKPQLGAYQKQQLLPLPQMYW